MLQAALQGKAVAASTIGIYKSLQACLTFVQMSK
jgi:hypothetical protein